MSNVYAVWDTLCAAVSAFTGRRLGEIQNPTPNQDGADEWPGRLRLEHFARLGCELDRLRPVLAQSGYNGADIDGGLDALCSACWSLAQKTTRDDWAAAAATVTAAQLALRGAAVAASASHGTPATRPAGAAPRAATGTPPTFLHTWAGILLAVQMRNNRTDKERLERLNSDLEGPILKANKPGGRPLVDKAKLLDWFAGLEQLHRELQQRRTDKEATVAARHGYGRDGEVVPDLAGGVKKRRKRRPT
jgi:hypothetical protein